MRLYSIFAIAIFTIACTTTSVNAQCESCCNASSASCGSGCCHSCNHCCNMPLMEAFCIGYRANRDWPAQYVPAARRSMYSAYDAMTNNGWRRQNLLGTYHFDPKTNELTDAGKLKVNWILSQPPQHRRSIFVQRGNVLSETASRVASVQSWANNISPSIGPVDINDTHIVAEGRSAGAVDSIFVGFKANQRPPVLPVSSGPSTNSSSSAK